MHLSSCTRQRDLNKTVLRHHPSSGFHPSSSLLPLLCRSAGTCSSPSPSLLLYSPPHLRSLRRPSLVPAFSLFPSLPRRSPPPPSSFPYPPSCPPPSLSPFLSPSFLPPSPPPLSAAAVSAQSRCNSVAHAARVTRARPGHLMSRGLPTLALAATTSMVNLVASINVRLASTGRAGIGAGPVETTAAAVLTAVAIRAARRETREIVGAA